MAERTKIITYLYRSWEGLLSLFFPPLCLHCKEKLSHSRMLFCRACSAYFELIYPKDYCPHCLEDSDNGRACLPCVQNKYWKVKCGAALENMEPPLRFYGRLARGEMDFLVKTAASFMLIQYFSYKWKEADYLIALRAPLIKRLKMGMDPSFQVAKILSKSLHIPMIFLWRKKRLIGKRVLFIDLTIEKLEWVREAQERLELKEALLFTLIKTRSAGS